MRSLRLLFTLALAWLLVPASASAADSVQCTIRSMHGLQRKGTIDPRLASLRRQLSKPPFSSFKTIALLESKELTVVRGKVARTKLPTKKILRLTFKERLLSAKKEVRLRMHLSITPPRALGFLPGTLFSIANGGTLLVAGDRYSGGTLVVGVTCLAK